MSEELKAALARIACLEGEIAKRDETIARLEPQLNRAIQANYDLREELAACRVAVENCEVFRARIAELEARIVWLECEAQVNAAPVPEAKAQGVVMPEGWIPLTIEHEPGYPEDVAFGPKRMMDRLKKWLDRYFEMRLNAAPVQQVSMPASAFASRAITHYEAALLAAFPSGSSGEVFNQWNEARRVLAAAPAAPAADASDVLDQAMYTLISIGYHENSGLVHELRQALAAHRTQGAV